MEATTDTLRPRAFQPESRAGETTPPPTPGWDLGPERRIDDGRTLSRALAYFAIGLGALELLAPGEVCDFLGVDDQEGLVRLMGLREIASGVGILSQRTPTNWIRARIAGDFLDLGLLGAAMKPRGANRGNVLVAIGAVAGVTALDFLAHRQLTGTAS